MTLTDRKVQIYQISLSGARCTNMNENKVTLLAAKDSSWAADVSCVQTYSLLFEKAAFFVLWGTRRGLVSFKVIPGV